MSVRPPHPGAIVMVNDWEHTERTVPVAEVPESIAYARVGDAWVPVTRVVATLQGDTRTLRSYGADGALLSSTIQVRPPQR